MAVKDFFVSYNSADKTWAEWIAWVLEEQGYTVVIQAWDFRPGGNFVLDMQQAAAECDRTIMVLSENYLKAQYTQPEWAAAFAQDPTGKERRLLPIRVGECQPTGILGQRVYVDLVDKGEAEAEQLVLKALKDRVKPTTRPKFPEFPPIAAVDVIGQKVESEDGYHPNSFCSFIQWIASKTNKFENLKPCYFDEIERIYLNPGLNFDITRCEANILSIAFNYCCFHTKQLRPRQKEFVGYRRHEYLQAIEKLMRDSCKIRKSNVPLSELIGDRELSEIVSRIEL